MEIAISHLSKRFGATSALEDISLTVKDGELLALLGPSGSGKTTLLRVIAGLERPDGGDLVIGNQPALDMAPRERGIGLVFQNYALFRHMSVADNIAFGLTVRPRGLRPSRADIKARVKELLLLVQLDGLADRFPAQLSGGQRQRIALARALAVEPKLLLLDEPFGALDAKVRIELRHWLRGLHDRLGITTVFVTHDQEEALELADRVAILAFGRIEQIGPPREVYDRPASSFVLEFLGEVNRVPCIVAGGSARVEGCRLVIPCFGVPDGAAFAYVRPHQVKLCELGTEECCSGIVRSLSVVGPLTRIRLSYGAHLIEAEIDRGQVEALKIAPERRLGMNFGTIRVFSAGAENPAKPV
jgi:sulfate transport system ATP-binding protein